MKLHSSAFDYDDSIPSQYTCDGRDVSPPLSWSDVPEGTTSFSLIVDDPDAPGRTWVHWVYVDLPSTVSSLPEALPSDEKPRLGGTQGRNDFRRIGYGGPCPPGGTHRYVFTLYALDRELGLRPGALKSDVVEAMRGHVVAEATLVGLYSRS